MKNAVKNSIFGMTAALMLCLSFASTASAQRLVIWKGGTPGHEREWQCAKNWSNNTVPDEFCDVVIPDVSSSTSAYPVVSGGFFEVNSLQIYTSAWLVIGPDAELLVHDAEAYRQQMGRVQFVGKALASSQPREADPTVAVAAH